MQISLILFLEDKLQREAKVKVTIVLSLVALVSFGLKASLSFASFLNGRFPVVSRQVPKPLQKYWHFKHVIDVYQSLRLHSVESAAK